MAISVQCDACKKRYQVPDTAAGKKIRCKNCGEVIAVPGTPAATPPGNRPAPARQAGHDPGLDDLAGPGSPPARPAAATVAGMTPRKGPTIPRIHEEESLVRDPADLPPGGDDGDDDAITPEPSRPANPLIRYPGAAFVDQFLPVLLALGGLAWLAIDTLNADSLGRPWLGTVRILIYLAAYGLIAFPVTWRGVRAASRKTRFGMPPLAPWRAFAAFVPALTLAVVFWLSGDSIIYLLLGLIVGSALSLTAWWLLFRINPRQSSASLATVGTHFAIGAAIAILLLVGINFGTLLAMRGFKSVGTYAQSPLGPGFTWDAPPPGAVAIGDDPDHPKPPKRVTAPTPSPAATQPDPAATMPQQVFEPARGALVARRAAGSPVDEMVMALVSVGGRAEATAAPRAPTTAMAAGPVLPPVVASSAVAEQAGHFEDLILPTTSAPAALLLRGRAPLGDPLAVYNFDAALAKPAPSPVPHAAGAEPRYCFTVDGNAALVAQIVDFPKPSVEVRSLMDDKVLRTIELNTERFGEPRLFGFAAGAQVAVLWHKGMEYGVEFFDGRTGTVTRQLPLPQFVDAPGNLALSPDGKTLAAAFRTPDGPSIQIYEINAPTRAVRHLYLKLAPEKPVRLSGMAFTGDAARPDTYRLAALYEEGTNVLITCWRLSDSRELFARVLFLDAPLMDAGEPEYAGRAIDWVADGNVWLIYARALFDVNSGKLIGKLAIPGVRGHRVLGKDALSLAVVVPVPDEPKVSQLMIVKLDAKVLNPGRAPAATKP